MLRERDGIEKLYMTIATGKIDHSLKLKDTMIKDASRNLVSAGDDTGKIMETDIVPIEVSEGRYSYTLAEANIHTGRTSPDTRSAGGNGVSDNRRLQVRK